MLRTRKMTYTAAHAAAGELAVRTMTDCAKAGYNGTDPITVYEVTDMETGRAFYTIDMAGEVTEGLTYEAAEQYLESLVFEDEDEA